ncbi:hypothetical protein GN958_ATG08616 [Phytophthora infestans]|uniref:Endonuclease/exonuclease/phosphatase domain-containing protein n=1 Tax=Phytophthora infestans TaxID=4787 RepID=A0A8S9UT00_PHYIN|nr:hypothetical protein GN958_ATG08616 [Phytophthora infestans]
MPVKLDEWLIMYVYVPAQKNDQLQVFTDLEPWMKHQDSIILGGDFNCELLGQYDMTDAVELQHDFEGDDDRVQRKKQVQAERYYKQLRGETQIPRTRRYFKTRINSSLQDADQ